MDLSSIRRFGILYLSVNILVQVVSCDLQHQPRGEAGPVSALNSSSHDQSQKHSPPIGDNNSIIDMSTQSYRDPKFVLSASMFTVVQFANIDCISSANLLTGTCYTSWDCVTGVISGDWSNTDTKASASGSCQRGFGSCCTSVLGCGGSSSNNNTWLRSPGYPSTFNSGKDCLQTITIEDNICQLRLEIDDLSLDYPDATGTCATDYVSVNHDIKFDKLCGVTKNNHFYLDVDSSSNSNVIFSFHADSSASFGRSWSIRVTKIVCDSEEEVPRGCGQYYTGTTGTIKGLNNEAPSSDDYILSKLNYGICVRMENGYCKNTYTEQRKSRFTTVCPDVFELPGRTDGQLAIGGINNQIKCIVSGMADSTMPILAFSYIAPHVFNLDTTIDTSNSHQNSNAPNNGGVYHMIYSQTKC